MVTFFFDDDPSTLGYIIHRLIPVMTLQDLSKYPFIAKNERQSIQTPNVRSLSRYVPALDSMRGLAVSMVFFFHAGTPAFSGGFIGVDIFFVLSGFLITILLMQEQDRDGKITLRKFYLRRALRLVPALVFMVTVYLLFCIGHFNSPADWLYQFEDALMALSYIANWTRAFDLNRPLVLGHTWSLAIEEQYYICWPLILAMLRRVTPSLRSGAIFLLLLASWITRLGLLANCASWDRIYNGLDSRADMLLAGSLLASLWHSGALNFLERHPKITGAMAIVGMSALAALNFTANWQTPPLYIWQYEIVALSTVLVIYDISSRPSGWISTLLNKSGLVWLGRVSYGFYLWHYPILWAVRQYRIDNRVQIMLALILTLCFTVLSNKFIELPFLRLKQKFR